MSLAEKGRQLGIELSTSAKTWIYGELDKEEKVKPGDFEKLKHEMLTYDRFRGKTVEAVKEEVCNSIRRDLDRVSSDKARQMLNITHEVICEGKSYDEVGVKREKGEGADRSRIDWSVLNVLLSYGVTNITTLEQLLPSDSKIFTKYGEYYEAYTLMKAWENVKPILEFQAQVKGKKGEIVKKITKAMIPRYIMDNFEIKTFYTTTGHNQAVVGIFVWDKQKGAFVPFDKGLRVLIRETVDMLGINTDMTDDGKGDVFIYVSKHDVDDAYDKIMDLTLTPTPPDPLRIAFRNGTIEWTDTGLSGMT